MSRNLLVTIAVVIVIILGAGAYMMNQSTSAPAAPSENNPQPSVAASVSTEKISLKNFMSMTGNQQCTFTDSETGNSGSVFIASGKMRGDFSSDVNGKVTPSHMINDSKDIYIWMDDQQTGFKTSLEAIEAMSGQTGVSETMDINKEVDYKCEDWTIDPLKFAVPAEVKFQDMKAAVQNMGSSVPSGISVSSGSSASNCSVCDNLTGSAKDQCRAALKC